MSEKFSKVLQFGNELYTFEFEQVYNEVLRNEISYIISCQGFEPFFMAYDFEGCSGFIIQGEAPYVARENEKMLSNIIEDYHS